MAHRKLQYIMPAPPEVVFDAFHYHKWRMRWDSLVKSTHILGEFECPHIGAISENSGSGLLRHLSMKTIFVSYSRPYLAAAKMMGSSFPFSKWAASMQHKKLDENSSLLTYTYTFEVAPRNLKWIIEPIVYLIFNYQTNRRFRRLVNFLSHHAEDIKDWQIQSKL